METTTVLKRIGLAENEVRVYSSLLETGQTKVNLLADKVKLPRTTVYGILKKMTDKGLVSSVIKSGVLFYESSDPERLLLLEKEKLHQLQEVVQELSKIKRTITEKPIVQLYEGKEGLKSVYEDMLQTNQPIYGCGNTKLLFRLLEFYVPNYILRRAKSGIRFYVITEKSSRAIYMKNRDKSELRSTRFIEEIKKMTSVNYIYGTKLAQITLLKENPIGIITESSSLTKSQKVIFDTLWKVAKNY